MDKCKTCSQYRIAEKPIQGFHGYTGTCYDRKTPFNRVRENGYCENYNKAQTK